MREQEIASISLFILTIWNMLMGALMISRLISVEYGMFLAFGGMLGVVIATWRSLMGDQRPWESPKKYRERKSQSN